MASLGEYILNIVLDVNSVKTGTQQINKSLDKISADAGKLNKVFEGTGSGLAKVGLAINGVQQVWSILNMTVNDFIDKANQAEIANAKLANGLKNVGEGSDAFTRLSSQAERLKGITPFDDEAIKNAQAMLTTFMKTSDEIEVLTPRILDLAAAYMKSGKGQIDLQQIAVMVGKVNEESIGTLRRYGVAFSKEQESILKSLDGLEQANYLASILDQNFKGMAETLGGTGAGKMMNFKNTVDDLKESFGFILRDGIMPFLSPLKSLIQLLDSMPSNVKAGVLALLALGAAMIFLNSSMPPTLKAFLAISALLLMLPGPIRILVGLLFVAAGAVLAFSGSLTILNVSLGGLPIIIGLIVTGLAAIVSALSLTSSSVEDFNTKFDESNKTLEDYSGKISETEKNLADLQYILDSGKETTVRSEAEQKKYNDTLESLTKIFPAVNSQVDEYTGKLGVNDQVVQQLIVSEKARLDMIKDARVAEQIKQIDDVSEKYKEQIDALDKLKVKKQSLEAGINAGYTSYPTGNPLRGYFGDVDAQSELYKVNGALGDSEEASKLLNKAMLDVLQTGMKFGNIDEIVQRLSYRFKDNTAVSNSFFNYLSSAINVNISEWNQLGDAIRRSVASINLGAYGPSEPTPGGLQEIISSKQKTIMGLSSKSEIQTVQKEIEKLQSQYDNLMGVKKTSTSSRSPRTSAHKDEKDAVDELIKSYELALEVYYSSDDVYKLLTADGSSLSDVYANINEQLLTNTALTDAQILKLVAYRDRIQDVMKEAGIDVTGISIGDTKNIFEAANNFVKQQKDFYDKYGSKDKLIKPFGESEYYIEILKLLTEINNENLREKDFLAISNELREKANLIEQDSKENIEKRLDLLKEAENYENKAKDFAKDRRDFELETMKLRVGNIQDEYEQRKKLIEWEFNREMEMIQEMSQAKKDSLGKQKIDDRIKALQEKKALDIQRLRDDQIEKNISGFTGIFSAVQSITQELNIGENTFISNMLRGMNQVLNLAQQIKTILEITGLIKSVSSFLGLGGAVAAIGGGGSIGGMSPGGLSGPGFYSRFMSNASESMKIEFVPGAFKLKGEDIHGSVTAYKSYLQSKRVKI